MVFFEKKVFLFNFKNFNFNFKIFVKSKNITYFCIGYV